MPRSTHRNKKLTITFKQHKIRILLDKVLIWRLLRRLHGRFWGLAAVGGFVLGLAVCFIIRPDLIDWSTAFSDFGDDVRTAPYFAGSVFFAAFGLWHWRNYLTRTLKRTQPITTLLTCTIIGLYLIALMPVSWEGFSFRLHMLGVAIMGFSVAGTVILDALLSKTKRSANAHQDRLSKLLSFLLIIIGGWITYGSSELANWWELSLLGELLMLTGYTVWIAIKTYRGEGKQSALSRLTQRVVTFD